MDEHQGLSAEPLGHEEQGLTHQAGSNSPKLSPMRVKDVEMCLCVDSLDDCETLESMRKGEQKVYAEYYKSCTYSSMTLSSKGYT